MEELSRTAQLRALHTYLKKALKEKYAAIAAAHIANAEIAGLSSGTRGAEAGLSQLRRLAVPSTPLSLPDFGGGGGGGGSVVGQLPLLPPNAGGGRRRRIATSAITSANDGYVPFDERYDTGVPQVQQIPQVQQTQMPQNGGGFQSVMQGIARGFGVAPRMQPQQQQYPMNAGPLPFQQQQPFQQPQPPPDIVPEQYVQHMQNLYAASRNPQMNPERFHEKLREAEQRYGHVPGAMDRLSKLGYIPHAGSPNPNAGPPDAAAYAGHMKNLYAAARDTSVPHDVFQKQLKAAQTKYGHLPNAKDRLSKLEAMRGRHTSSPTPGPNYAADMARLQAASTNPKLGHGDFHKLHQELQLKHRSNPAAAAAMQKAMQRRATLPGARQFASELAKKKTTGAGTGAGVKAGVPSRPLNYMADMKRLHAAAANQKIGHADFHKLHDQFQLKHRANPSAAAAMQKAMQRRSTVPGAADFARARAKQLAAKQLAAKQLAAKQGAAKQLAAKQGAGKRQRPGTSIAPQMARAQLKRQRTEQGAKKVLVQRRDQQMKRQREVSREQQIKRQRTEQGAKKEMTREIQVKRQRTEQVREQQMKRQRTEKAREQQQKQQQQKQQQQRQQQQKQQQQKQRQILRVKRSPSPQRPASRPARPASRPARPASRPARPASRPPARKFKARR